MICKDGPLEIEVNPDGQARVKTFLSATEDEIREHGFKPRFFQDQERYLSSLVKDKKLSCPGNYVHFSIYQNSGDGTGTDFEYELKEKWTILAFETAHRYSTFRFKEDAGSLFQNLSDVEDAIEMLKPVNGKIPKNDLRITITKPNELYHVTVQPFVERHGELCVDDESKVERDVQAKDMKEFLPQLRETELDFIKQEREYNKALEEEYGER